MIIKRDIYLQQLISKKHNSLIKVMTGLRRSGKSFLLFTIFKQHLLTSGVDSTHIIEIKFDEDQFQYLKDHKKLMTYIKSKIIDKKNYYILLDEIQEVDNFEPILIELMRIENVDVYVTGSNSKFLSTDIDTRLNGKNDPMHIFPLSFNELLPLYENKQAALYEYLTYGGLPWVHILKNNKEKRDYLSRTFNELYMKDIISRYRIDSPDVLNKLVKIIASNVGSYTNINKICNTFKSIENKSIKWETLDKYIRHLSSAFVTNEVTRYDLVGKKFIGADSKYYFEDVGIRNNILDFRFNDMSHLLENIVYNELIYQGYDVHIGNVPIIELDKSTSKYNRKVLEVDFVVSNFDKKALIQVCSSIENSDVLERECKSLLKAKINCPKIIITAESMRPTYTNDDGIIIMNIFDFLTSPFKF